MKKFINLLIKNIMDSINNKTVIVYSMTVGEIILFLISQYVYIFQKFLAKVLDLSFNFWVIIVLLIIIVIWGNHSFPKNKAFVPFKLFLHYYLFYVPYVTINAGEWKLIDENAKTGFWIITLFIMSISVSAIVTRYVHHSKQDKKENGNNKNY